MTYEISVENIKCGGCAGTITKRLNALDAVCDCLVDVENGVISITFNESHTEINRTEATQLLLKLGYPEIGTAEGLKAAKAKAKSFVSCAVGKMSS
ncbi:MAG: hypothetical protein BMS9Abin19_0639 [Gammaproteobacteria bacterium]|nr:MAG: hypothetical protein BMS9Abin19_0639 [Gammaproteobacteria bacterium]